MPPTLTLPRADGSLAPYTLSGQSPVVPPGGPIKSRIGMAAVHVVADPLARIDPTLDVAIDWDATLAYRRHLYAMGWPSPRRWTPRSAGWDCRGPRRRS
jgi:hypothetical protein